MTDPLTAVDNIVREALTGLAGLTGLVRVSKIQLWDRAVDIRGEVETATDMGGRCWLVPLPSEFDLNWSSGSVKHVRKYAVGFGVGNLKLEECRKIERQVQRAMARLNKGLKADAVADEVLTASLTAAGQISDSITATFQVQDAQGNNLSQRFLVHWNLSDADFGVADTSMSVTTAYTNGAEWQQVTANKKAIAYTDGSGTLKLTVTHTGSATIYLMCEVGGKVQSVTLNFSGG